MCFTPHILIFTINQHQKGPVFVTLEHQMKREALSVQLIAHAQYLKIEMAT